MNELFDQTVHVVQEEGYELFQQSLTHYTFQKEQRQITYTFLPHLMQHMMDRYPMCKFAAYVSNQLSEKRCEIEVVVSYKEEDALFSFLFPVRVEERDPSISTYGLDFRDMFFAECGLEHFANGEFFEEILHYAMKYIEELPAYRLYFATGMKWKR